jgi:uncharacterized hydrophobic protein (TIGR00271 family)
MSTTDENNSETDQNREAVRKDARGLLLSLKTFFTNLLDFRADTDRDNTIEAIKMDIPFKGATAWILICSIFVASVGLNANSTAVVIGAMLISPLMGPILGIGLSLAINDIFTLRKSLVNFGVMVLLSVLTAFLFFLVFPLRAESSELLARTQPDIRDVLIAFFGGLALIIARTKKGTIASVIFGVAIATALMPPLCTVGYGLAEALLENDKGLGFAAGAMYLFIINTIFIALATFLVLKLLRFPMLKYANSQRRKNIARMASFLALLVMIPAGFTFYRVLKKSTFENSARRFIDNELKSLPNFNYIKRYATFEYQIDDELISKNDTRYPRIELNTFGVDQIPETSLALLKARFADYAGLNEAYLITNQSSNSDSFEDEVRLMQQLRTRDSLDLLSKNEKIALLEKTNLQLDSMKRENRKLKEDDIPFEAICRKSVIFCDHLLELSYSKTVRSNLAAVDSLRRIDTLRVFNARWSTKASSNEIAKERNKLYRFLREELKVDTLVLQ